ncbi:hypothetical protein H6P81_016440 [Aristolochia fimbriata]|uniref:Uncharacterized protein n=1 Tax=Aristolochia fimbriata TaxID=158543 RepID=A0AAV7E8A9_ARIFI|nr:hypothetical protein H6P81_016440 [Aristolochia fimbriata]
MAAMTTTAIADGPNALMFAAETRSFRLTPPEYASDPTDREKGCGTKAESGHFQPVFNLAVALFCKYGEARGGDCSPGRALNSTKPSRRHSAPFINRPPSTASARESCCGLGSLRTVERRRGFH